MQTLLIPALLLAETNPMVLLAVCSAKIAAILPTPLSPTAVLLLAAVQLAV